MNSDSFKFKADRKIVAEIQSQILCTIATKCKLPIETYTSIK